MGGGWLRGAAGWLRLAALAVVGWTEAGWTAGGVERTVRPRIRDGSRAAAPPAPPPIVRHGRDGRLFFRGGAQLSRKRARMTLHDP